MENVPRRATTTIALVNIFLLFCIGWVTAAWLKKALTEETCSVQAARNSWGSRVGEVKRQSTSPLTVAQESQSDGQTAPPRCCGQTELQISPHLPLSAGAVKIAQMSPELLQTKESTPGLRQPKKEHRLASSCSPCAVGLQQASCNERLMQASR